MYCLFISKPQKIANFVDGVPFESWVLDNQKSDWANGNTEPKSGYNPRSHYSGQHPTNAYS